MADVYVPVDRIAALVPTAESIVDADEPAVTTAVRVYWPQGLRGVMMLTVAPRTARRLRRYEALQSPVVRWIVPGLITTSMWATGFGCVVVARLGWPVLVWPVATGLFVPTLLLAARWLVRVPQRPVDRGEGWVVLRRIDPVTAQRWQLRNPSSGMVIEAASRRPRSRPSGGQNWWETQHIAP